MAQRGASPLFQSWLLLHIVGDITPRPVNGDRSNVFTALDPGSGLTGADMQTKFMVALQLKVAHHFIERLASGRARRVEDPGAGGTAKAPKMRLINPNQLSAHGLPVALSPNVV
jgi:hypothetical protein